MTLVDAGKRTVLQNGNFPWLDGIRGLAAFWVFVSHVLILSGVGSIPILSEGGLAVDLFMLISGFLMTHHYILRRDLEPWSCVNTWQIFWVRRFFRIAPLYYVLLVVALISGPYLGQMRDEIAKIWPHTATTATRYQDSSLENILAHLIFVFGAWPKYSFATPLPDWSIGLEMQFYLVFPFLMWAVSRFGIFTLCAFLIAVCLFLVKTFWEYFYIFQMPSFLPMKLHIFFIGIWLAMGLRSGGVRSLLVASIFTAILSRWFAGESLQQTALRVIMVTSIFYLLGNGSLPSFSLLDRLVAFVRTLFSTRLAVFLGDTSYGFYLVHLLILLPVSGHLAMISSYQVAPALARFSLCLMLTAPVAYAISWVLHQMIETTGIRIGKTVAARLKSA